MPWLGIACQLIFGNLCFAAPPADAVENNGSYYKVIEASGLTWEEAARACLEKGGSLVSIESDNELAFVKSLGLSGDSEYSLGLFDRDQSKSGYNELGDADRWMSGRPVFMGVQFNRNERVFPAVGIIRKYGADSILEWKSASDTDDIAGYIVEWEERVPGEFFIAEVPRFEEKAPEPAMAQEIDANQKMMQGIGVLREIASSIVGSPGVPLESRQASIGALLVSDLGSGKIAGSISKLNLTAIPTTYTDELSSLSFNQEVGPQMMTALREVVRFTRINSGGWPSGHQIEISFTDKYIPKDGPSAAVACALLLDSVISGKEIRESFAVTGDLNADGLVQPIGGVAAKLRAVSRSEFTIVAIPSENREEVNDMVILNGLGVVAEMPVFQVSSFKEAARIAYNEDDVSRALEDFSAISEVYRRNPDGFRASLAHPEFKKRLTIIHQDQPLLLSAEILREISQGTFPEHLSLKGSLVWIDEQIGDLVRGIRQTASAGSFAFQDDGLADAIRRLQRMRNTIDPRCVAYSDSIADFGVLVRKYIQNPPAAGSSADRASVAISEAVNRVDSTYEVIMKDTGIVEELLE